MTCRVMGCSLYPHDLFSQARSHICTRLGLGSHSEVDNKDRKLLQLNWLAVSLLGLNSV